MSSEQDPLCTSPNEESGPLANNAPLTLSKGEGTPLHDTSTLPSRITVVHSVDFVIVLVEQKSLRSVMENILVKGDLLVVLFPNGSRDMEFSVFGSTGFVFLFSHVLFSSRAPERVGQR